MEIGKRIRARREELGLTQEELARELGVTHQHVSSIEGARTAPSLDLVVKLAGSLGLSTDYLLVGEDRLILDLRGAVRATPDLTSAAKRHLLGLIDELRA